MDLEPQLSARDSNRPISRSALSEPVFRRYLTSSCASTLGTWLTRFLLGWQAWDLSHSAFCVGAVSALMLTPALFLTPFFGVVSDRVSPRNGMLFTITLQGLVAATAGTLAAAGLLSLPWLLVVATAIGVVTSAHQPLRLALIPKIASREAMPSAIGLSAMVFNSARIIGPALGGWVLVNTGSAFAFFSATLLFFTATGIMITLKGVPSPPSGPKPSIIREIGAGLSFVRRSPLIALVFGYTMVNGLLGRSVIELLPALSGQLLQGDPGTLATLAATAGGGSIIGGLVITRQSSDTFRLRNLAAVCLLLCTATLLPVHWIGGLLGLCVLVGGISLLTTMVGTACQIITQLEVADPLRGRVLSLWSVLAMASPALGTFVMGALADLWGFPWTLTGVALGAILAVASLLRLAYRTRPPTA